MLTRVALVAAGFFAVAIAPFAKADDADVSLLYVEKTQRYLQAASPPPTVRPNPFTIKIGANHGSSRPNGITSGTVQIPPPLNTISDLTNDGSGNFILQGGNFPDVASLNASFPNGRYFFQLQTATNPTSFANNVSISGDSYPTTVPRITGATWATGGLQVDASQNYLVSWQTFVSRFASANTAVILQIVDGKGVVVFNATSTKDSSAASIPAGTLQPGQFYYSASLTFQNKTTSFAGTFNSGVSIYSSRTDFTIATIEGAPVVSGPSAPVGMVGQLFVYQIIATNHPFSFGASPLPAGLTLNSTLGVISGIPTTPGTVPATLTATNIDGQGNKTDFAITIQPAPSSGPIIISSTSAMGFAGQPFTFQVATRGATEAARVTATGLPTGLTIDQLTGKISGATISVGSFPVDVTVTDGSFTATGFVQLTFTADLNYPVITNADTVLLRRSQPFNYKIATPGATDPADPVQYAMVGNLPAGLSFNAVNGTITGTPRASVAAARPDPDRPDQIALSGGALLGSIQLFGTNSHGTSTFQLLFLTAPAGVVNISTRLFVSNGDNVLIGGIIITGNAPKAVIVRALGPSIGVAAALQDPVLELHNSSGSVITNDDWRTSQEQLIKDTTIPPADDREAAIVVSLDPGSYTAVVSGKNGETGIGLVEVYDLGTASLDINSKAQLAQISTRGKVLPGDDVMIGGFIVSGAATNVIARAIGPSLSHFGVANALADPTLELFNGSGTSIGFNDDWRSTQEQAIKDTTVPPTDDRESAIVASLAPSAYTAIVRGKNNTTGIALVEVYSLP